MENKNIYIPGDLVMYNGKVRIIKEPRDKNHFDLREPETNLRVCYIPIDEISGVELTSEVLEKNGWKHDAKYWSPTGINEDDLYDCFKKKGVCTLVENNGYYYVRFNFNIELKIKHIHELQHLLFGLGINSEMEV